MIPSAKEVVREVRSRGGVMNTLSDFIIRPPRADYDLDDLGPDLFRLGDKKERFVRDDFTLENMRGMTIQCSWYKPFNYMRKVTTSSGATTQKLTKPLPCVVYCHANCGSRYDGLEALLVLKHGMTLVTFDFCGSGWSDGEYISLGFYERQDLAVVTEYLQSRPDEVDGIGFWGRSMGAVTSIMYAAKDPSIRCIVCDSPFGSLRWLIQDLVTNYGGKTARYMPNFVVNAIIKKIRGNIAKRAAFDIDDLNTIRYASECTVPALIFHGREDDFVLPKQSIKVSESFIGPCLHQLVDGGHNSERTEEMTNLIVAYLRLYMIEKPAAARALAEEQAAKDKANALANVTGDGVSTASSVSAGASSTTASGRRPVLSGLEVQQRKVPTPLVPMGKSSPPIAAQSLHPHLTDSSGTAPRPPRSPTRRRAGVDTPPAVPSPRQHTARASTPPPSSAPALSSEQEFKVKHLGLTKVNTLMAKDEPAHADDEDDGATATDGLTATAGRSRVNSHDDGDDVSERSRGSSFLAAFVDPEEIPRALPIRFTVPRMDRASEGTDAVSRNDMSFDNDE